jgi:thioredoxin reductase
MVLEFTPGRHVYLTSKEAGFLELEARAIVLAMGCRERTRAQIRLPGTRPAGIYTAGAAQRFVNVEGYMPGNRFVILGSGDIGMIMARRLTFEGGTVAQVLEIMPFLTGLTRNYVQCLLDFDIPLRLQHTVSRVIGNRRVEAVETVRVDRRGQRILGTEEIIPCDTLLLSVGLIPENELSRNAGVALDPVTGGPYVDEGFQTSIPGVFAAGNVVHVYDLVDRVTEAGFVAGKCAARFAAGREREKAWPVRLRAGANVRYVVPHTVNSAQMAQEAAVVLQMRVERPIEKPVWVEVRDGERLVTRKRGQYARPGEMMTIKLPKDHHQATREAQALTVSVVER